MQVRYSYFYYTIYCNPDELQLYPKVLANYFYYEYYFLPNIITKSAPYIFKGGLIDSKFTSLHTAEYPYYYYKNKLFVNFKGELTTLPQIPSIFNGFVDENNSVVVDNVETFPSPLDIIKIGNNTYKLNNEFTFDYDFATKQMIILKLALKSVV
jgi:hypothetical protein